MNPIIKKRAINRLKRVEGQIRGLQKIVEKEKYCVDIIHQSLAVKSALSGIEDLILENHLFTHVAHQMKIGATSKAAKEMVNIYKLSKKR